MNTNSHRQLDENFSVSEWLESLGLSQYAVAFIENGITPDLLVSLTDSDLKECGVNLLGHRKVILIAVEQLKQGKGETAIAAPEPIPQSPKPFIEEALSVSPAHSRLLEVSQTTKAPIFQVDTAPLSAGPQTPRIIPNPGNPPIASKTKNSVFDRFGGRFLYISIIVHVIFGLAATWWVVQRIEAKRKQTFSAANKGPTPGTRALEHKVQVTKKKNTMSAPPQAKRITTTAVSARVAIPEMKMPMTSDVTPSRMSGLGGASLGLSPAPMGGIASGGGGGGISPFFGLRTTGSGGVGLKGSFYDLKQTKARQPSSINSLESFVGELNKFVTTGWKDSFFVQYYKAPKPLYATQMFIPVIPSATAPKEFGVEKEVQPNLWMALYKGKVSPPESGTYYFVGGGDNILIVRLNGKVVMDRSWNYKETFGMNKDWNPVSNYDYGFANIPNGFAKGLPMQLDASEYYDMELLIGDDGGITNFSLLVEKEGETYQKTSSGFPILPVFRLSSDTEPAGEHPPFQPSGPVWKTRAEGVSSSIFFH